MFVNRLKDIFFDAKKGKIKLSERASIFFFCLLLSTFFWFLSILSKSYTTTLTIPLEYEAVAENFILTEEPRSYIKIEVFGSGFELLGEQVSLNRSEVQVDLNVAQRINKDRYGIATTKLRDAILVSLDKDLNLRKILTDSITFKTQKKVRKKVPIVTIEEIKYAVGYNLREGIKLNPDSVEVSGPEESISKVEFVNTEEIQLNNVSDSVQLKVMLKTPDVGEHTRLSIKEVEAIIPVEKYTEKQLHLPLTVLTKRKGVKVKTYPNEVKAILIVPLSKYEAIDADMLSARVTFDKESSNRRKLKVELSALPAYARLLRLEPESVEFIIKK